MRFPFGLSPRPRHKGPYYADIHTRGMAMLLDLAVIFYLMRDAFDRVSLKIFGGLDQQLLQATGQGMRVDEFLARLWYSGFINLWIVNALFQFFMIGVIIVTVQCCFQTTPGKWLMGISIRRVITQEPIARWRYPLRYLSYFLSVIPLMLGVIWISFNREHRAWHDFIAGTVVINNRPPGWYWSKIKQGYRWLRQKLRGDEPPPSHPVE